MSFANALSLLRPTLPYYLALTKYGLLRLTEHSFEFHPHPAAPPLALEMAKAVFMLGASSCIESYATSRMLAEGPALPDAGAARDSLVHITENWLGGVPRWPPRRTGCPGRGGEAPDTLSSPGPARLRSRLLRHRCPTTP